MPDETDDGLVALDGITDDPKSLGAVETKFLGPLQLSPRWEPKLYAVPTPISCCIPTCTARHRGGWVIEVISDERLMIGHDCAKKHLGMEWPGLENAARSTIRRVGLLNGLTRLRLARPALQELVNALLAGLNALRLPTNGLSWMLGKYLGEFRRAMETGNGALVIYQKSSATIRGAGGRTMQLGDDERVVGVVQGYRFFSEKELEKAIPDAIRDIDQAIAARSQFAELAIGPLRTEHKKAARALERLVSLCASGEHGILMFSTVNYRAISAWARAKDGSDAEQSVNALGQLCRNGETLDPLSVSTDFAKLKADIGRIRFELSSGLQAVDKQAA